MILSWISELGNMSFLKHSGANGRSKGGGSQPNLKNRSINVRRSALKSCTYSLESTPSTQCRSEDPPDGPPMGSTSIGKRNRQILNTSNSPSNGNLKRTKSLNRSGGQGGSIDYRTQKPSPGDSWMSPIHSPQGASSFTDKIETDFINFNSNPDDCNTDSNRTREVVGPQLLWTRKERCK